MLKLARREKTEWIPLELAFGMPLFDMKLNHKICKKIRKHELFSAPNLKKFLRSSRELSIRLLDFINDHIDQEVDLDSEIIPYPSKNLTFERAVGRVVQS
jgi:hypothetical protein